MQSDDHEQTQSRQEDVQEDPAEKHTVQSLKEQLEEK